MYIESDIFNLSEKPESLCFGFYPVTLSFLVCFICIFCNAVIQYCDGIRFAEIKIMLHPSVINSCLMNRIIKIVVIQLSSSLLWGFPYSHEKKMEHLTLESYFITTECLFFLLAIISIQVIQRSSKVCNFDIDQFLLRRWDSILERGVLFCIFPSF